MSIEGFEEGVLIGFGSEAPAVVASTIVGGGKLHRKRRVRLPRKWSDEELVAPIRPEIIIAAATVSQPAANPARELYLALEKRNARRDRLKKIGEIAIAFMDS